MRKILLTACTGIMLVATSQLVLSADGGPHDKAIQARQAMFKLYGYHMGILGGMAKGKIPYDAAIAAEASQNLDAAANLGQSTFWPAGSDNSNDENVKTRALKAIWDTYPEIVEKGEALTKATGVLAQNAGNGLDALKANMADVGAACKGCHDDYRAKKKK
ncbi:hypothetical protein AB833_18260 [Chromatiales bacterium (ex Bugula neritina AB1)]|nr:hypothetical protein AB833_18260 [Chromatiales bacterium (ex Bugula neritina AB1)]